MDPCYELTGLKAAQPASGRKHSYGIDRPKKDLPHDELRHSLGKKYSLTGEQLKYCYNIIKELCSYSREHHEYSWLFQRPLDTNKDGLHDNLDATIKPVDLSTVKRKLEAHEYRDVMEFANDVRLIFHYCYRYLSEDNALFTMAKKLQLVFEVKVARMPGDTGAALSDNGLESESGNDETSGRPREPKPTTTLKRSRGRPRIREPAVIYPKRPRGRPPKPKPTITLPKRTRGRPRKSNEAKVLLPKNGEEDNSKLMEKQPNVTWTEPAELPETAPVAGSVVPPTSTATEPLDVMMSTSALKATCAKPKNTAQKGPLRNDQLQKLNEAMMSTPNNDEVNDKPMGQQPNATGYALPKTAPASAAISTEPPNMTATYWTYGYCDVNNGFCNHRDYLQL